MARAARSLSAAPEITAQDCAIESIRHTLLAAEPSVYYVTEHYERYPMVLVRLSSINREALRDLLELAWQAATSRKQLPGRI